MLFNSYIFLFLFLPISLAGFHLLRSRDSLPALVPWLALASLFFYGWWKLGDLALMLGSVSANYLLGGVLLRLAGDKRRQKAILAVGIAFNLTLLGYFKYVGFFIETLNQLVGSSIPGLNVILPLGISFYTFQQIVYLIDTSKGQVEQHNFLDYLLFVAFFPHLIAGPIVQQAWLVPVFARRAFPVVSAKDFSIALTIFCLGLFKKVVIADGVSGYAIPVFAAAELGVQPNLVEAWCGALAYTFQLYFDFSGYSDMAVGLGLMFGIKLPLNFYSPYKSPSIIEFWRRWHITLSTFLRYYLYIPFGGNRHGPVRRYANILLVMLIGGLWHGANWTFVVWGGVHGCLLVINHAWRRLKSLLGIGGRPASAASRGLARLFTFLAVVLAWVIFRSPDWRTATSIYKGMAGLNGAVLPETYKSMLGPLARPFEAMGFKFSPPAEIALFYGIEEILVILLLLAAVWLAPNGITWISRRVPEGFTPTSFESGGNCIGRILAWKPNWFWAGIFGIATLLALLLASRPSEFIYFQF